jgi:hypothetical protein
VERVSGDRPDRSLVRTHLVPHTISLRFTPRQLDILDLAIRFSPLVIFTKVVQLILELCNLESVFAL